MDSRSLEHEIEALLDQERFEPPEGFAAQALVTDESLREEASTRP